MKRLAAVALIAIWVAFPACAQRSASHGGPSARTAPAFHGGFARPAPSRFSSPLRDSAGSSLHKGQGFPRGGPRNPGAPPASSEARRRRMPYRQPYRGPGPYGVLGYGVQGYGVQGLPGPYPFGYADSSGNDDSQASPNYAAQGYDAQPGDQEPLPPRLPYQMSTDPSYPSYPSPVREREDATTIVFKDGRTPDQIHNYILTRTTLFILDQPHRDIPLDRLDLPATAEANRDAGVDFRLPDASR